MTCKGFSPPQFWKARLKEIPIPMHKCVFNLFLISASVKPEMLIYFLLRLTLSSLAALPIDANISVTRRAWLLQLLLQAPPCYSFQLLIREKTLASYLGLSSIQNPRKGSSSQGFSIACCVSKSSYSYPSQNRNSETKCSSLCSCSELPDLASLTPFKRCPPSHCFR